MVPLISQLWGKNKNVVQPSIYATHPDHNATDVPLKTTISASFNMLMDKSTINTKTFIVKDNSTEVIGTISFEGGNAILNPANLLSPNCKYTAKITKDAKSMTGDSLENEREWSFTTEKPRQDARIIPLPALYAALKVTVIGFDSILNSNNCGVPRTRTVRSSSTSDLNVLPIIR